MRGFWTYLLLTMALCGGPWGLAADEPAAHWDFDEGAGETLHDRTGHGNDGRIYGAKWVRCGSGHALRFDGAGAYVNCGRGPTLDIRGPMTISAWVLPLSVGPQEPGIVGKHWDSYVITYYRGGCWWYISGGGNGVSAVVAAGEWHHVVGTFDGQRLRLYVDGEEKSVGQSRFQAPNPGGDFTIGCILADPNAPDPAMRSTAFFEGLIDEVKVYPRALTLAEIVREYNRQAAEKGRTPFDESRIGRLGVQCFHYPARDELVVDVDYRYVQPIPKGERISLELMREGDDRPVATSEISPDADPRHMEAKFSLKAIGTLAAGSYAVRATLKGVPTEVVHAFDYPLPALHVPLPSAGALPPPPWRPAEPEFDVKVAPGGGFSVTLRGVEYPVESSYSSPGGGDNLLAVADAPAGTPEWNVEVAQQDALSWRVKASGRFYTIERSIRRLPHRVEVADRITNRTDEVLGVALANAIRTEGKPILGVDLMRNWTLFVRGADHGLGLIALDDVYQCQHDMYHREGRAAIYTDRFGLDAGASYTIEWAVYPTATPDYYDFINAVRSDYGLGLRLEGAWCVLDRREPPPPGEADAIKLKRAKYLTIHISYRPPEDNGISIEGIEFLAYPGIVNVLKNIVADTRSRYPDAKVMFHVAHGLYATGKPREMFPDSLVLDERGEQRIYGPDSFDYYGHYFSRERFDGGWRWWIFYPTMENSFGRAMLRAMDVMLDEIGADAMWGDGFFGGYARGYTYNAWDGHSVEMDPATKTVRRKIGNVTLLSLPVLRETCRKISSRGGLLFTNGEVGPRSFWNERYVSTCETGGADQQPIAGLYLGPTVVALGDPTRIHSYQDLYEDMLSKLRWGCLYFWYGEREFANRETLVTHMYPITVTDIHSGWVRGEERIVTSVAGVFGWPGDRHLHQVIRFDRRGERVPNDAYSTCDGDGLRTDLPLRQKESAVLIRVPVEVETEHPINVLLTGYGPTGLEAILNGAGQAKLILKNGELAVTPGREFSIAIDEEPPRRATADASGRLIVNVTLERERRLRVAPVGEPR